MSMRLTATIRALMVAALVLVGVRGASTQPATATLTAQTSACTATTTACAFFGVQKQAAIGIQITGTFSATVQFEQTIDGTTWTSIPMTPYNSTTTVTSATAAGLWTGAITGNKFRVRCSTFSSGSIVVSMISTTGRAGGSGGGGIAPGSVTEADLSFTDVTTANASSTKHGLMPKLSGNAFNFALGDGTYSSTVTWPSVAVATPWIFTQTWNDGGSGAVQFEEFRINATDTSSYQTSRLLSLKINNAEVAGFDKTGKLYAGGGVFNLNLQIQSTAQVAANGYISYGDGTDFNAAIQRVNGGGKGLKVSDSSTGYQELSAQDYRLIPNGVSQPTCDSTTRGTLWYTSSGAGVADKMEVCAKSAADAYAWRSMATIP